ncbi:MAG: acyl--CoA ligase [Elusimicrobia bacterium]|nr:acyl--CoA ligase [Elusimicrobiota bacterium]
MSGPFADVSELARRHEARPFLISPERGLTLTYGGFHKAAGVLAGKLAAEGLSRGDRLVAILPNSVEFAILYFAALRLGVVVMPVNPALHPRDAAFAIEHSGAKLQVFVPATRGFVMGKIPRWELPRLPWTGPEAPPAPAAADDLLTIVFTSGTTAFPKAVAHKIGSLFGNARAFNEEMELGPGHRFLHLFPMAYSGGFFNQLISPFCAGASVVMTPGWGARSALDFWSVPRANGVNALWLNPTIAAALLRVDRDDAGRAWCRENVTRCFIGTAPLHARIKREFEARYGVALYESYGLSETLLATANGPKTGAVEGASGKPLPGVGLREIEGEICVHTPHLMAGTLNYETSALVPPAETEWFPTGDLGMLGSDGLLRITGRKKDVILRAGLNVSPRALEEVLMQHEAVEQAAVVGVPNELTGEEIVAIVRLKPGFDAASVESYCRTSFAASYRPSAVLVRDEFPVGSTGKVSKQELRSWAAERLAST